MECRHGNGENCLFCVAMKPYKTYGKITIGETEYKIQNWDGESHLRDGNRLWTCSIALSNIVNSLNLENVCELGCGLGLPSMVLAKKTNITLIDHDRQVLDMAELNFRQNDLSGNFICDSWSNINSKFDSIVGSELFHRGYDIESLVAFIDRCWTKRGQCIFVNSEDNCRNMLLEKLKMYNLHSSVSILEDILPNGDKFSCYYWEIF